MLAGMEAHIFFQGKSSQLESHLKADDRSSSLQPLTGKLYTQFNTKVNAFSPG